MTKLWIQETWINETEGYQVGESEVYETSYEESERGKLFASLRREYGRCISCMFVGEDNPIKIGWVFQKKVQYQDTKEFYNQSTWVSLHKAPPTKTIRYNYA